MTQVTPAVKGDQERPSSTTMPEPGSAYLAVITSRLRGLWKYWSGDPLGETRRIGGAVRVAFSGGNGPR
jgi:hypothetical protein